MREWLSWFSVEYADQIEMMLRLCGATIAGMAIGINRDIHNKPIGMRTLGLVALGSSIVILSGSVYEGLHFGQDAVSRVVQGILTGLGFLGAGSILDRKSTRLNSSHANISYAVFCLKKKSIRFTSL